MTALAKRAVACKGWRVMVGMVSARGDVVRTVSTVGGVLWWWDGFGQAQLAAAFVPDLSHPATLGCLLALVREAWGLPGIHAFLQDGRWLIGEDCDVLLGSARAIYSGSSEAEALVAALEAAPS